MSLSILNGSFGYPGGRTILREVNLLAEPGQILAILGPNGVGKTTLIRCMLGILPWREGYTSLDEKPLKDYSPKGLWQKIAYVPQAKAQSFSLRVEDMVLLGRSPYLGSFSQPGKKDKAAAERAMKLCGITRLKGKLCNQLSGGELQLVLIARALAAEPSYLILDEPESGLDFRNQVVVLELLRSLRKEQGLTVILNTHYPDHALRICDHSLLLFGNGIHLFGRTENILTEEHMQAAFGVHIRIRCEEEGGRSFPAVIPLQLSPREEVWTSH